MLQGTLTENGLSMKAVLPTEHSLDQSKRTSGGKGKQVASDSESSLVGHPADVHRVKFVPAPIKTTSLPTTHLIKQAMACCHSATNIEGP